MYEKFSRKSLMYKKISRKFLCTKNSVESFYVGKNLYMNMDQINKNRNKLDGADVRLFDFSARKVSIVMKCSHLTWKSMKSKLFKNTLKC